MIQFTSMVMNRLFERFPTLRVSYTEAGSGWVPERERVRVRREC